MSGQEEANLQYQRLLEALTACVNAERAPVNDEIDIVRRKEQRDITDHRVRDIQTVMSQLVSNLNRDRNCYLPISRLVDDILIEIWSYLDLHDRFMVSHVCYRWRSVAINSTKLWNEINVELFSISKLRQLISRSGSSPLRISANTKRLDQLKMSRGEYRSAGSSLLVGGLSLRRRYIPYEMRKPPTAKKIGPGPHFFPQSEFNAVVGRAVYLNAVIGSTKAYYVTPDTLKIPMPHLKTLKLIEDSRTSIFGASTGHSLAAGRADGSGDHRLRWFFRGETPSLRAVSFDYIHAAWEDPLYTNLTRLRLGNPSSRCTLYEILTILQRCPNIEELELVEALSGSLFPVNRQPRDLEPYNGPDSVKVQVVLDWMAGGSLIELARMRQLTMDDADAYGMSHLLSCITLPALQFLSVHVPDSSCLTDQHNRGQAFPSLIPTFAQTKNLQVTGGMNNLSATGTPSFGGEDDDRRSPRSRRGGWSYLCRPRTRTIHYVPNVTVLHHTYPLQHATLGMVPPTAPQQHHPPLPPLPQHLPHVIHHQFHYPTTASNHGYPQFPSSTGICDPLQFLHQAELSGVNYAGIERLELGGTLDDIFYRDILARCANVKYLRLMSHRGINILVELIGVNLCRHLQEIQLFKFDSSARVLADWVDARARRGLGLHKVVVQVAEAMGNHQGITTTPQLDTLSRTRMENALGGARGALVWKNAPRNLFGMSTQWVDMIEDGTVDWEREQSSGSSGSSETSTGSSLSEGELEVEFDDWFGDGVFPPVVW